MQSLLEKLSCKQMLHKRPLTVLKPNLCDTLAMTTHCLSLSGPCLLENKQ